MMMMMMMIMMMSVLMSVMMFSTSSLNKLFPKLRNVKEQLRKGDEGALRKAHFVYSFLYKYKKEKS